MQFWLQTITGSFDKKMVNLIVSNLYFFIFDLVLSLNITLNNQYRCKKSKHVWVQCTLHTSVKLMIRFLRKINVIFMIEPLNVDITLLAFAVVLIVNCCKMEQHNAVNDIKSKQLLGKLLCCKKYSYCCKICWQLWLQQTIVEKQQHCSSIQQFVVKPIVNYCHSNQL